MGSILILLFVGHVGPREILSETWGCRKVLQVARFLTLKSSRSVNSRQGTQSFPSSAPHMCTTEIAHSISPGRSIPTGGRRKGEAKGTLGPNGCNSWDGATCKTRLGQGSSQPDRCIPRFWTHIWRPPATDWSHFFSILTVTCEEIPCNHHTSPRSCSFESGSDQRITKGLAHHASFGCRQCLWLMGKIKRSSSYDQKWGSELIYREVLMVSGICTYLLYIGPIWILVNTIVAKNTCMS